MPAARGFMLNLITDLGDSALIVPASATMVAYLLYLRSMTTAAAWITALALCAVLTLVAKIGFHACGAAVPFLHMQSPSGHTSLSTTFYGACAVMIARDKSGGQRVAVLVAGVAVVLAIAASRVILRHHTATEVFTGLAIGLCSIAWFVYRTVGQPSLILRWRPVLVMIGIVALLSYGEHWDFESIIEHIAGIFRSSVPGCA
jgi:membrane-associated phospholipid phosphatase